MSIDAKLAELGVTVPEATPPLFNYIPTVLTGNLLYVSGQISRDLDGKLVTGKVCFLLSFIICYIYLLLLYSWDETSQQRMDRELLNYASFKACPKYVIKFINFKSMYIY